MKNNKLAISLVETIPSWMGNKDYGIQYFPNSKTFSFGCGKIKLTLKEIKNYVEIEECVLSKMPKKPWNGFKKYHQEVYNFASKFENNNFVKNIPHSPESTRHSPSYSILGYSVWRNSPHGKIYFGYGTVRFNKIEILNYYKVRRAIKDYVMSSSQYFETYKHKHNLIYKTERKTHPSFTWMGCKRHLFTLTF